MYATLVESGRRNTRNPQNAASISENLSKAIQHLEQAIDRQLDSDPNVPIPAGLTGDPTNPPLIHVSYRFQFNRPADTIAVDYDSREVIDVLLTVRNFPTGTVNIPQTLTLQASAAVRNFLR